jgi:hypothetical protein
VATQAHPPRDRWHLEYWEADRWMQLTPSVDDRQRADELLTQRRKRHPGLDIRIVRLTTTYTVEEPRS